MSALNSMSAKPSALTAAIACAVVSLKGNRKNGSDGRPIARRMARSALMTSSCACWG